LYLVLHSFPTRRSSDLVRVLQIAILWYSVFTFLCAFAQNFEQLFILRGLHGLGFGGEWATGAVLMGEVIRDKYRGRGFGFVQTRSEEHTSELQSPYDLV